MNNVLGWVKTNWLIVVCCLVMVVSLVAGYIGSNMWATSQRKEFQTKVQQQMSQVQGARVNYAIPTLSPDERAVTDSGPPNAAKTRWFAERIEARVGQAAELVRVAEDFNRGRNQAGSNRLEHGVLVAGLFPQPADDRVGTNLRLDFRDAVIGEPGRPSALARLMERYGAGPSADLRRVQAVLMDLQDREAEAIRTQTGADPTEDDRVRLQSTLTGRRIQEFQRAARDVSMYGTESVFARSTIPVGGARMTGAPDLTTCFAWQWDYWVASDILAALALANTGPDGLRTDVERGVVKRIQAIEIEPITLSRPPMQDFGLSPDPAQAPLGTITGRPEPGNQDYDIRYVKLRLVVSSERLPMLFDALARTNYMSVVDLDLADVDAWADLRAGFYYGPEHVVAATIRVETVWLRSWTGPLMPPEVRAALGVVVPEPTTSGSN